jgi:hypothetical protein
LEFADTFVRLVRLWGVVGLGFRGFVGVVLTVLVLALGRRRRDDRETTFEVELVTGELVDGFFLRLERRDLSTTCYNSLIRLDLQQNFYPIMHEADIYRPKK